MKHYDSLYSKNTLKKQNSSIESTIVIRKVLLFIVKLFKIINDNDYLQKR